MLAAVEDPPTRTGQARQRLPCRTLVGRLRIERGGRLRHGAPGDGIYQRRARWEVRVEGDAADARAAGDSAHRDVRVAAQAVKCGLDNRGDAALSVRPAPAFRELAPSVIGPT